MFFRRAWIRGRVGTLLRPVENDYHISLTDSITGQQTIRARRKCPLYQTPSEKGWVPSRAEDFLATDQQRERCREVLMRSALGLWGDTDGGGLLRKKTLAAESGRPVGRRVLPGRELLLRPSKRKRADGDDGDKCKESPPVPEWCEDENEGQRSLSRE